MRVEIWSDVVCPWCYVGKRRFERALEIFPHRDRVEVVHRSFQLNPAAPRGTTTSRRQGLMAKYNLSPAEMARMDAHMAQVFAAEGLLFQLDDGVSGNTFDAHRLLHLARTAGRQEALLERFFRAYFSEGRSLFDAGALAGLAVEAGLEADDVSGVLAGEQYAADVTADMAAAREFGVTGVPFFALAGRLAVSGAQPVDVLAQGLTRAWDLS
jgi:predicted DsbA family dithiol-disulfide isomerase